MFYVHHGDAELVPIDIEEDAPVADSATVARTSGSESDDVAGHRVGHHLIESGAKPFLVGFCGAPERLGCAP